MDNRRLNARAEMGATAPAVRTTAGVSWLDRAIDLSVANWEVILYAGLMLLAILTRLWDLGPRALHHDESIHAYYSNLYYKGGGYDYDPTYHGPFLYHIVALGYLLFGTTDATARLMPAVFGIIIIGMCWLLRPFIGRVGALIAVLLLTLSPSISYYSRSLRHDIFALAGLFALFIGLLWFMRTHQAKWVYLGAVGLIIAYASHEGTYLVAVIFTLFLVLAFFGYRLLSSRTQDYGRYRTGDEDVNPVGAALQSLMRQPWTLIGAVLVFFAIYFVLFSSMLTDFAPRTVAGEGRAPAFIAGLFEGLTHWAGEHGVARGSQPGYYYLLMLPIYEPLALLAGLGTLGFMIAKAIRGSGDDYHPADQVDVDADVETVDEYDVALPSPLGMRGLALSFLAFWSFGALVSFSIAGEKMPWLLMWTALPLTLLASAGLGRLITSVDWRAIVRGGGLFLGVAVVLFLFAAFALMRSFGNQGGDALQRGVQSVLLFLFAAGLLALAGWLAYKILPGRAVAVVALTFSVLLALYGLRSMMLANYRHGDVPIDMLVYTQSSPDVPIVAQRIQRLSRDETAFDAGRTATDVTGGRGLQIGIDQLVEWPFDWYLRDMRSITYYATNDPNNYHWDQPVTGPLPPVMLVADETVAKPNFTNAVEGKYISQKYVLRWWFPEELYKTGSSGDLGKTLAWVTSPAFMKYLLYRDPGMPLGSTNFNLYVRNDLAYKMGMGTEGTNIGTPGAGSEADPNVAPVGMFELGPAGANRGQFNLPRGIAQDSAGNFYVVDTQNQRVQKFDKDGNWLTSFGSKGEGDGQFKPYDDNATGTGPGGVAVDGQGNVYVADTWNHRIQKFDANGKFLLKWGSFISLADPNSANDAQKDSKFYGPRGVAVGPDGNVYVTDTGNKRVVIFDANGKYLRQISSGLNSTNVNAAFNQPGQMNEPIGVAVDAQGNVYVADSLNKRIQKFDGQGKPVAQWPVPGEGWSPGPYLEPFLAVDAQGNVYATAPTGKNVLKFSPAGQVAAQKNRNLQGSATIQLPTGITVGSDGTVYVVDTNQHGVLNLGTMQ
jgi:uncharacterized protein (TIGR03663 family)